MHVLGDTCGGQVPSEDQTTMKLRSGNMLVVFNSVK